MTLLAAVSTHEAAFWLSLLLVLALFAAAGFAVYRGAVAVGIVLAVVAVIAAAVLF